MRDGRCVSIRRGFGVNELLQHRGEHPTQQIAGVGGDSFGMRLAVSDYEPVVVVCRPQVRQMRNLTVAAGDELGLDFLKVGWLCGGCRWGRGCWRGGDAFQRVVCSGSCQGECAADVGCSGIPGGEGWQSPAACDGRDDAGVVEWCPSVGSR
jgi:hypothetical protein